MAGYVDGYVLPILKKNLKAYRRMAKLAGKIWREHGALDYKECSPFLEHPHVALQRSFRRRTVHVRRDCHALPGTGDR